MCKLIEVFFFENARDMMQHPTWRAVVMGCGLVFTFTLVILIPIQILIVERRDRRKLPRQKLTFLDLIGIPFGVANPDAEIPKWISYPVLGIFWLLIIVVASAFIGRLAMRLAGADV
jgi:ethanolamine transporter EutH